MNITSSKGFIKMAALALVAVVMGTTSGSGSCFNTTSCKWPTATCNYIHQAVFSCVKTGHPLTTVTCGWDAVKGGPCGNNAAGSVACP